MNPKCKSFGFLIKIIVFDYQTVTNYLQYIIKKFLQIKNYVVPL